MATVPVIMLLVSELEVLKFVEKDKIFHPTVASLSKPCLKAFKY